METTRIEEFQVSPRVKLTPGEFFKASAGPYFQSATGRRSALTERSPSFKFNALLTYPDGRAYVEAVNIDGLIVRLLARHNAPDTPGQDRIVRRPYTFRRCSRMVQESKATKRIAGRG